MALDLKTGAELSSDPDFQLRVVLAFQVVARSVLLEDEEVSGHELRAGYARSVMMQNPAELQKYTALIVTSPEVYQKGTADGSSLEDDDIIQAVSDVWNRLANFPG